MLAVHASVVIAPRVRASAGLNGRVARAILRAPQKIVVIGGATSKRRASVVASAAAPAAGVASYWTMSQ